MYNCNISDVNTKYYMIYKQESLACKASLYLLDHVIESDYMWATNHINNIINIFNSMEPLWQTVNIKNVLVNTFNVVFLQKAHSRYVIPIVTNCHVEQKFNSYSTV